MTKGIQTKRIDSRDWEALSAYLDGQLAPNDRFRIEKRLQASSDLRTALDELRRTRTVLRSQPRLRAPRNFTLTPEMVGKRKTNRSFPILFPALGIASALASALFIVVLLFDLLGGGPAGAPSIVAMQVTQEAALRSSASTEAPAPREALPQAPEIQEQAEVPAATEEAAMALEAAAPTQSAGQMTEAAKMTAAPPGMGEMPTPMPETGTGPEGTGPEGTPYPLLSEAPASALAATESAGTPAIPTPAPMLSDTVSDQQETLSQKSYAPTPYLAPGGLAEESGSLEPAAPAGAQQTEHQPAQPGFWTPLRLLEAGLALIAVAAGAAAFLVRRIGSG